MSPCSSPLAAAQQTPPQQPNSFPSSSSISTSCRSPTPSFRCQQRLTQSKRVSSPTSSRPWLVVTAAISLQCDDIFQHPAVVPCHGSQQSHSGAQVFSLALQLRDRCVSSTSILLLQILVTQLIDQSTHVQAWTNCSHFTLVIGISCTARCRADLHWHLVTRTGWLCTGLWD